MRYSYQTFLSDKPLKQFFSKKPRVLGLNFPLRYNVIFYPEFVGKEMPFLHLLRTDEFKEDNQSNFLILVHGI